MLALALLAYTAAILAHGNGFVAAFDGRHRVRGHFAGHRGPREEVLLRRGDGRGSQRLLAWMLFGAVAVPRRSCTKASTGGPVLYAALSLTAVRMIPVALSAHRRPAGAHGPLLFVGWFGPRGLALVIFALIAVEELGSMGRGSGDRRHRPDRAAQRRRARPQREAIRRAFHPASRAATAIELGLGLHRLRSRSRC